MSKPPKSNPIDEILDGFSGPVRDFMEKAFSGEYERKHAGRSWYRIGGKTIIVRASVVEGITIGDLLRLAGEGNLFTLAKVGTDKLCRVSVAEVQFLAALNLHDTLPVYYVDPKIARDNGGNHAR
ncbi:MAG: hypothetical protein WBP12_03250 [Candidatus Saccharimonas sp.]